MAVSPYVVSAVRRFIMDYRKNLLKKLKSFDFDGADALPLVSLEDFFVGNEDKGSIGCNLDEHPGIEFFFETLQNIRNRKDVQDVLVEINEIDGLEEPDDMWAFSDRVYIITSESREEVAEWVETLMPDEIEEGWAYDKTPALAPQVSEGNKVYGVWWD